MILNRARFIGGVAFVSTLSFFAGAPLIKAQCAGLHAGLTAQVVPHKAGHSDPEHVSLTFLVVNDSNSVRNVTASSWKIVINGNDLPDSGWIFGNGPGPVGGFNELKPGESYQFGKALPVSMYFKKPGEYKVSWKANAFQSPTILIKIPAQ